MKARLANLKVVIGLSKEGLRKLNKDIRDTRGKFRRNFGEIAGMAKTAATAIGTTLVAGLTAVIKAGMDLERTEVGFRSIVGGSKEAAAMVGRLNKFAAETPFQLDEISSAAKKLLATGSEKSAITEELKFLGDVAAASGNSINDITAIFTKVRATGKVSLENLNQLAERNIPIFSELKKVTGDANMEFGAGAVSVEDFNEALRGMAEEGGLAEDAMLNLSQTASGKLTTAIDNTLRGLAEAAEESGALAMFTDVLDGFTNTMKGLAGVTGGDMARLNEDFDELFGTLGTVNQGNVDDFLKRIQTLQGEIQDVAQYTTSWSKESDELLMLYNSLESAAGMLNAQITNGSLPAAKANAEAAKKTKEEFEAEYEAAKLLREEQERLESAQTRLVITNDELQASLAGIASMLDTVQVDMSGLQDVALDEEEPLIEEGQVERIAETEAAMARLAMVGANTGNIFGFMSSAVGAAFDNIKDKSAGFHEFLKAVLESLVKRAAALVATFAALSIITGGSAGALKALGQSSFKDFFMGGMGVAGFASGGLVTGATLAMVGEGPGTSLSNPEVIAPLDKLQSMMGGGAVTVTGMIRGSDILISNERSLLDRNRVRGF